MSENEKDIESKQKRSPRFPVISIGEAIEKARRIYEKDRRAFATMEAILEHMGFTPKMRAGGRSGRTVAALKQYGLLDERAGKYRISDTAFKILELPEESSERDALIREAAFSPPIFRKVLAHFDGELPSDTTLRSHLIFSEGFNPDSARDFIKVLRRTLELATPQPEDYTTGEEPSGAENLPLLGAMPMQPPPAKPTQGTAYNPSAAVRQAAQGTRPGVIAGDEYEFVPLPEAKMEFTLYLSQTKQGVLSIPLQLTRKEWELLKRQIQSYLDIAEAVVIVEDEPPAPKTEITRGDMMKARGTGELDVYSANIVEGGPTDE